MSASTAARGVAAPRARASLANSLAPPKLARAHARASPRVARAVTSSSDGADGASSSSPSPRRVARRVPRGDGDGAKARASGSEAKASAPKVRKVRKLSAAVKEGAKSRQVISADRREREAVALERFLVAQSKLFASSSVVGTADELIETALREETSTKDGGESAGERLKRLFKERRERGMGMVRDRFNDGGAVKDEYSDASFGADSEEYVEEMLESAAEVEEQNKRLREGYSESEFGVSNSIDPFKLVAGEFVVHRKYGIGQYLGLKVIPVDQPNGDTKNKPFLFLKYQDATAKISPEASRRLLYRFCSPGALVKPPKLNKLKDSTTWDLREKKTEATIRRLVVNQMVIYLQRLQTIRNPYELPPAESVEAFDKSFPYKLTPDQVRAVEDITIDLSRDAPMDRLVIGDVGFGKTEVAMRAIFHVASSGGGVFMMAPTTVLAKQHAANLAARFRPFGINVELVTRHVVKSRHTEIFEKFKEGTVQIIVGTHKLVNLDSEYYRKLKLLVIDEEQRFGVKHKDQISALKAEVDVLTLSATPIPRTLHMAMSGFRDASLVQTPPPERRPINTILAPQNDSDITRAIEHELNRNGQVYYIVPRVSMMKEASERLNRLFPELRIMTCHGQMDGDQIDDAMEAFSSGTADVLIATTIVESGLDIPNCNTIIIENVQFFGLATLYQLRGRVGRAGRQAYAYMFYSSDESELTPAAQERLAALEECCGLGEGFRMSERDMGIRGVGTMFGEKQSGDVDNVGADLYLELLYKQLQRIDNLRIKTIAASDVRVETAGYEFGITPFYIATTQANDEVKAAIDSITVHEHIHAMLKLLQNTFGEPDEFSLSCLFVREMQILAGDLGIKAILLDYPKDPPIIDLITDASLMVKELLVEGTNGAYDVKIMDNGIRFKTMTDMTMHGKVMYVVSILRQITSSIPSFVKYL